MTTRLHLSTLESNNVVAIVPVELLTLRVEMRVEDFAPEYAYEGDIPKYVGKLLDIAVARDFVDEYRIIEELTAAMVRYTDYGEHECRERVRADLAIMEDGLRYHLVPGTTTSWEWYGREYNTIVLLLGDL